MVIAGLNYGPFIVELLGFLKVNILPFFLLNFSATYQRLTEDYLSNHNLKICIPYSVISFGRELLFYDETRFSFFIDLLGMFITYDTFRVRL